LAAPDPERNTPPDTARDALVAELEQRIDEFDRTEESAFGEFTTLDWVLCAVGSFLIPYAVVWWFAH
jgi:hypothetical protein